MAGSPGEASSSPRLTHEQKVGAVMLLIFAVICVTLGFLQIRNRLYGPLALSDVVPGTIKDSVNSTDALRYRDTDGDGLSDYDELYVYSTSPYLKDSDSDGIPDNIEIANGTDPLCAQGKDCSGPIESGQDQAPVADASSTLNQTAPPDTNSPDVITAILNDPAQVRQLLLSAGVKKADLDKMTDAQIEQMVAQTLAASSSAALAETAAAVSSQTSP